MADFQAEPNQDEHTVAPDPAVETRLHPEARRGGRELDESNEKRMNTVVRFARSSSAPGLEIVHYPDLTRGWRGIPEAYTWFTLIDRLQGDVEVVSRGIVAPCQPRSLTIGEPGEPYVLRPRSDMRGEFRVVRI